MRKNILIKVFIIVIGVILLSFQSDTYKLPSLDFIPFKVGEKLVFILHYGAINAGTAVMEINPTLEKVHNEDHFHIKITGKSIPTFDKVFKVRDYYESFVNTKTMLPTIFLRDITEADYKKKEYYLFNQKTKKILSEGKVSKLPYEMHDLVSTFYYLRCISFVNKKVGAFYPLNCWYENEVMELGMKLIGREVLKSKIGKINCLVFEPVIAPGRIFDGQHNMKIFVSDDKNQIPVRIESFVFMGKVAADLTSYSNLKYDLTALVK
ncbi:MAG: DUF3108 domain-containing protein [Bacteroidota bacterium]|nr:DUF3108 domain-containing protein [Bacteroidota bacterium]